MMGKGTKAKDDSRSVQVGCLERNEIDSLVVLSYSCSCSQSKKYKLLLHFYARYLLLKVLYLT